MVRAGRNRLMSAAWAGCLGFALALAGCTVFPSTPTAHTTRPPKPTALPNPWRQVMLPTGATMDGHSSLTISPLDGSNAWFCTLADAGTFSVWTTHDAGVTWRQISTLSPSGPAKPWGCALTIDQRDPQTLAVMFESGAGEAGDLHSISYLSTDGGAQWTRVPGLIGVDQLESAGGNLYAILTDTAADPAIQFPQLAVSTDDLQTWKGLRPSSLTAQDTLFRFWVDQSGRPLFAASYRGSLWQTTDQGAIWTQLPSPPAPAPPAPPMQIDLGVRLTQQSQWDFCGWSTPPVIVQCSTDMGASWVSGPSLTPPGAQNCFPSVLRADGAMLAFCPAATNTAYAPELHTFDVYRLPFGGQAWQRLTLAPAQLLAAPPTGAVWLRDEDGCSCPIFTGTLPR